MNRFLHADVSSNLFLYNLKTHTYDYPLAIRNDKEDMTICFVGNDYHALSLRKARNSHTTNSEKQILSIFEVNDDNMIVKLIYIRKLRSVLENTEIESQLSETLRNQIQSETL